MTSPQSIHGTETGWERDQPPRDGFGPGYFTYSIASDFHALCCLIGFENARREIAEVINDAANRKHTR